MNATTVAVDWAKAAFSLAVAVDAWRVVETHRLTRTQFEHWFANREVSLVIMEPCGSAHHWARWLTRLGIEVKLLPVQYVLAYVKRNKAACALANKMARICYAASRDKEPFAEGTVRLSKKINCQAFVMPA